MAKKQKKQSTYSRIPGVPLASEFASEVAEVLLKRLPSALPYMPYRRRRNGKKVKKLEGAFFLDTSAIIDGRIFEVIRLGLLTTIFVVPEEILLELKHIADSQDTVKRERGRKGLVFLEELKKKKGIKLETLSSNDTGLNKTKEVDERLISLTKSYKGKIITCDYNLEKKASIQGVLAVNVNALANALKITAVPGEALHIQIQHRGKDTSQGVGYLDDGTMIVVEQASTDLDRTIDVVVSRVLQTSAGRILFAKKI